MLGWSAGNKANTLEGVAGDEMIAPPMPRGMRADLCALSGYRTAGLQQAGRGTPRGMMHCLPWSC